MCISELRRPRVSGDGSDLRSSIDRQSHEGTGPTCRPPHHRPVSDPPFLRPPPPALRVGARSPTRRCGRAWLVSVGRLAPSVAAAGVGRRLGGRQVSKQQGSDPNAAAAGNVGRRATRPRGVSWVCWARPAFLAPPPAWPFGSRPAPSIPTRFRSNPVVLGYCSGAGLGFWIVCSNSNFDTWGRRSLATAYTSRRPPCGWDKGVICISP